MTNVKNIKIGGVSYPIEDTEARTQAAAKLSDFKINGVSAVSDTVANLTITDGVTSTSTSAALSANQGKVLNDRIDALAVRGRFLALWSTVTGKPTTDPETLPYTYHTGDYYIVSAVGTTNYIPSGTSYSGTASTTTTTDEVKIGDQYLFDGTKWDRIPNVNPEAILDVTVNGVSVRSGTEAVILAASSSQTGALTAADYQKFDSKQDALTFDDEPTDESENPVTSGGVFTALAGKQNKIIGGTAGNVLTYTGTAGSVGSLAVDTVVTLNSSNLVTSGAVATGLAGKQSNALVTAWQATVDDTHYPSEKLVKDALDGKQATIAAGTAGEVVAYSGTAGTLLAIEVDSTPASGSEDLITSGAVYAGLAGKEPTINASHKISAAYVTETETNKFNVQANWTATEGLAAILNKPTSFTPSAHAESHGASGSDAITIAESQVTNLTTDLAAKQTKIPAKVSTGTAVVAMSATAGTVSELAVDTAATASSTNLITSGAVKAAIDAFEPTVDASGNLIFGPES